MSARDPESNFIDPQVLFSASGPGSGEHPSPTGVADQDSAGPLPKITRLPEGIEVIEQKVGRAVGTWVLQVRCQCGRRWFEAEPVDATYCPRCGMYVYIDVQSGRGPRT